MKIRETNEQLIKHLLTVGAGTDEDPYVLAVTTSAGGGGVPTGSVTRLIEESGDTTYIGSSALGEPTSGVWSIQKIVALGATTTISFAEGAWDDRVTLTYA